MYVWKWRSRNGKECHSHAPFQFLVLFFKGPFCLYPIIYRILSSVPLTLREGCSCHTLRAAERVTRAAPSTGVSPCVVNVPLALFLFLHHPYH